MINQTKTTAIESGVNRLLGQSKDQEKTWPRQSAATLFRGTPIRLSRAGIRGAPVLIPITSAAEACNNTLKRDNISLRCSSIGANGFLMIMNVGWSMRAYRRALSAFSPFLLVVTALGGCSAPVASPASEHFMLYRSLGTPNAERQPVSAISEGIDRHLKTILISDILDDPTNNEVSAEVYPMLQRIGREEGFTIKVVEASPSVWIRDDFLTLANGTLLAPSQNPDVKQALKDFMAYRDPTGHVYATGQGHVNRHHEVAALERHARENGMVYPEFASLPGGRQCTGRSQGRWHQGRPDRHVQPARIDLLAQPGRRVCPQCQLSL